MCRHLAYLGPPVTLRALLTDPPHGLGTQAWAPRRQCHGTMNVDGFGVGWYADGDPVPARYRRAGPIWADPGFADLARVTRTRALLAAVRSATEGTEAGAAAAAPYTAGPWLFSHNGRINGWPGAADSLAQAIGALAEHQVSGRFNFLLSNGEVIAATAAGDTLCYRLSEASVVVASEPGDDEPGWTQVSDQCVLTATPGGVEVCPLPVPARTAT